MINPKTKLWKWGPIDGRPIYPDPWYVGMTANSQKFSPGWPENFSLYKAESYSLISDYKSLYNNAEKIFKRFILDDIAFQNSYRSWQSAVKQFVAVDKVVHYKHLAYLSNIKLYELIRNWYKIYSSEFWGTGLLPEIANFGGEYLLRKNIERKLQQTEAVSIIEKLSAPERYSFYQVEERDLLRLRLIENKVLLAHKLEQHKRKYHWLLNSYHSTRVLPLSYFKKRLLGFTVLQARHKLNEIAKLIRVARTTKLKLVEEFSLGDRTLKIARRLAFCIWWQDDRKSYIFQANYTIDVILRELSRRYKINFNDLHWYTFSEVLNLTRQEKKVSLSEIARRKRYFVVMWQPHRSTKYISGDRAKKIYQKYQAKYKNIGVEELRGQAVSLGNIQGRVRIVLSPKEAYKMKLGEILVTTMTSPDFIVALRKAAAVVTDTGGITSHAAIVSRELKIPCIVDTKFATKVFKDGDLVEVDANKGIIKKM